MTVGKLPLVLYTFTNYKKEGRRKRRDEHGIYVHSLSYPDTATPCLVRPPYRELGQDRLAPGHEGVEDGHALCLRAAC